MKTHLSIIPILFLCQLVFGQGTIEGTILLPTPPYGYIKTPTGIYTPAASYKPLPASGGGGMGPVGAIGTIINTTIAVCSGALYVTGSDLCRDAARSSANYLTDEELGNRYGDFKPGYDLNAIDQLENIAKNEKNESSSQLNEANDKIAAIVESNRECKEDIEDFTDLNSYKEFEEKVNAKWPAEDIPCLKNELDENGDVQMFEVDCKTGERIEEDEEQ